MSKYSSTPATVKRSAEEVYDVFADLTKFAERIDNLPEDVHRKLGDVTFEPDAIAVQTPQLGELRFEVTERVKPDKIVFGSPAAPIPMSMMVLITPIDDATSEVRTELDVEIPAMLRPFVGPKLQQAADKFGEMIANLSK